MTTLETNGNGKRGTLTKHKESSGYVTDEKKKYAGRIPQDEEGGRQGQS
jgi:hypothetical protein